MGIKREDEERCPARRPPINASAHVILSMDRVLDRSDVTPFDCGAVATAAILRVDGRLVVSVVTHIIL